VPIYEFYCSGCNTIYSFLSRAVVTDKRPLCPNCKKDSLHRQVSLFATVSKGRTAGDTAEGEGGGLDDLPIDESKMTAAMEKLAGEAEGLSEEDPRQAARLMRKFSDMTGLRYKDNLEQALQRMEAGEDPEAIEKEMGDSLEGDEMPFEFDGSGKVKPPRAAQPRRDDKLYEM
jgi:putative FmdB family regulatory protein